MTYEQLKDRVESTVWKRCDGYDCSEYAEDAQRVVGGKIYSFVSRNWFQVEEPSGPSTPYCYHTVLLVETSEGKMVVDVTGREMVVPLDVYRQRLIDLNPNTVINEKFGYAG